MKLFGSLKELLAVVWRKDGFEITSRPNQATTYTAARDIQLPAGDANHVLVSASSTATFTNKTFDADGVGNNLSNVDDGNIKAAAAINVTKLADGSVDNTEFQRLNSAGTAGAGNLVTTDGTQTLTLKSIDGDDNTITDLAITSLKTVLADANKVLRRDASGVAQSGNLIPNASALVTTDASQTLTGKGIDGDDNTVTDLAITALKTVLADANKVLRRDASGVAQSGNTIPNTSALVTDDSTSTLTNKTLTSPNETTPNITTGAIYLNQAYAEFREQTGNGTNYIRVEAPDAVTTNTTLKLPDGAGTSNQFLQTDGAGNMTWATAAGVEESINTTAITGSTTIGTSTENVRVLNSATAFNLTLNNTFLAGRTLTLVNEGTAEVSLLANDASVIATIYRGTTYLVECRSSAPATNAAWIGKSSIISTPINRGADFTVSGLGTVSNKLIYVQRVGKMMHVQGRIDNGTPAAASASINLPTGLTIDYNAHGTSTVEVGVVQRLPDTTPAIGYGTDTSLLFLDGSDTDSIFFSANFTNNNLNKSNGNALYIANDSITFHFTVAITEWSTTKG